MLPIILETTDEKARADFIHGFVNERQIKAYNCFVYEPKGKEFEVEQIREIISETNFSTTEPRLFHILKFDSASAVAQNAFLKTLEEHQPNLNFILSVEQANRLLSTVKSRSRLVKLNRIIAKNLSTELRALTLSLESGKLPSLFKISNKVSKVDSYEFFDSLTTLYREKLQSDLRASKVLKTIIKFQNMFKNNHIDSQTAIDAVLISIYRIYNPHT